MFPHLEKLEAKTYNITEIVQSSNSSRLFLDLYFRFKCFVETLYVTFQKLDISIYENGDVFALIITQSTDSCSVFMLIH